MVIIDIAQEWMVAAKSSRFGRHCVPNAAPNRGSGPVRVSAAGGKPARICQDYNGGRGQPLRTLASFRIHGRTSEAPFAGTAFPPPPARLLRGKAYRAGVFPAAAAAADYRLLVATGVVMTSTVFAPADEKSEKADDSNEGRQQDSEQEHVTQHLFFLFLFFSHPRFRRSRVSGENQGERASFPLPLTSLCL